MSIAYNEFKKLIDDKERWTWLIENPDAKYMVFLDNDYTYVEFDDSSDNVCDFDYHIGNASGLFELLDALNIKADCV